MIQVLLAGAQGGGKSTLFIRLAAYLSGRRRLAVKLLSPGRSEERFQLLSEDEALLRLSRGGSSAPPGNTPTGGPATLLRVDCRGCGGRDAGEYTLVDSPGLPETTPEPAAARAAAHTLELLMSAPLVLHVVDAARVGERGACGAVSAVDREIWRLRSALARQGGGAYAVVANKMDLPLAQIGCAQLADALSGAKLLQASALQGRGLKEIKHWLRGAKVQA